MVLTLTSLESFLFCMWHLLSTGFVKFFVLICKIKKNKIYVKIRILTPNCRNAKNFLKIFI